MDMVHTLFAVPWSAVIEISGLFFYFLVLDLFVKMLPGLRTWTRSNSIIGKSDHYPTGFPKCTSHKRSRGPVWRSRPCSTVECVSECARVCFWTGFDLMSPRLLCVGSRSGELLMPNSSRRHESVDVNHGICMQSHNRIAW